MKAKDHISLKLRREVWSSDMHSEVESIQIVSEATEQPTTSGKGRRWEEDTNPKNSNDDSDRRAELKVKESGCFKEGKQSSTRPNEAERSSKIFRSS